MDIRCVVCGEPWYCDLSDMEVWERKLFRAGAGCPSCGGMPLGNPWHPETIADVENGDRDPMERIAAYERFQEGRAPAWREPDPVVLWACDGCGVESVRDGNGDLSYRIPRTARAAQWYHSHPFASEGDATPEPAHTFGSGLKVCGFCLGHCADCGAPLAHHVDHPDTYSAGNSFLKEGDYRTDDSVCIECYESHLSESDREDCEMECDV